MHDINAATERRRNPSPLNAEGCQIIGLIKNVKVMEQTNIEREMDAQEIKRLWQQLAIGTAIALVGLVFMGIGEAICRWLEGM
jgi:hypothetical protein